MGEWKEYKLDEVYDFASGLSKGREEFGFGYGFLSYKDIFENYFVPDQLTNLVNSSGKEREKCSIKRGDVFLTRTSETDEELGLSSVALIDYPNATYNGFTKRLRPKGVAKIMPEYAGFYFRSPRFRASVSAMSSVTTRASLNNGMLAELKVIVPPINIQSSIAETLISQHYKIGLLHRQNKTLEALAETLFRQWFVEEAKGGWEKTGLNDIAIFLNGLPCQKYPPVANVESLPVIKIKELRQGITDASNTANSNVPEKYIVRTGDILFSWSGSLEVVLWAYDKGILNQHLFKVTSDKYPEWFFYFWIKHHLAEFRNIAQDKATTMGHIKRHHLSDAEVVIPPHDIIKDFDEIINPMFTKIKSNLSRIRNLTSLRDTLLPKLMSGEVRVK